MRLPWLHRERALHLALRQHELMLHGAMLRRDLAEQAAPLKSALGWADRGQGLWQRAATHPALPFVVAGLALLLVWRRPRRVLTWAGRLWWGWRLVRRWQRLLGTAAPPR
jgi:hypothetical protein